MAFFDELTKKAQLVAGAAAEKAKDLAETATEKAKAATDAAKMNMEILSEQRGDREELSGHRRVVRLRVSG